MFLVTWDLGFSVVETFADRFPYRYLNGGVAEQSMMGLGTGLCCEVLNVFVYSIGGFPTLRCMEQIRYDVGYYQSEVKIVVLSVGYAFGPIDVLLHTTEHVGMLRTLPGVIVTAPGDKSKD